MKKGYITVEHPPLQSNDGGFQLATAMANLLKAIVSDCSLVGV